VTVHAINLTLYRLEKDYGKDSLKTVYVDGLPRDLEGAKKLADLDRYWFQAWAVHLIGLQSMEKGSDRGVDGVGFFMDDNSGKHKKILGQVKSGAVKSGDVRDFVATMEREKAVLGAFICFNPPTKDMKTDAAAAGFYQSPMNPGNNVPRVQFITVPKLLDGSGRIETPHQIVQTTHKIGKGKKGKKAEQIQLLSEPF
jgi:site-specific DNA-methyltransferase (adenine-specific)